MESVAELVELPARVAELASLLNKERDARAQLEASFRKVDQRSLDALVEDSLEKAAMRLRAEFNAEFPKHRQAITRLRASHDAAQTQSVKFLVESEFQQLAAREERSLEALRAQLRDEVEKQLKDGLGVVCGTQDDWLRELVAGQLVPLQQRLDEAEAVLRRLQSDAAEAAEMEAVVLERLDAVAQAVAEDELPQLPTEVGDSILGLRHDFEQIKKEVAASGRVASEATATCKAALARFERAVAETAESSAKMRDDIVSLDEQLQSCEKRAIERKARRESVDERLEDLHESVSARLEALDTRLEALDDLGTAQGAKLLRVSTVVDEWETEASHALMATQTAAREAAVEAASKAMHQVQLEAAAAAEAAAKPLIEQQAAAAAEAAVKPLIEQLETVDRNARDTVAELQLRLDEHPWGRAVELSDDVDALRSELASNRRKVEQMSRLLAKTHRS